MTRTLNCPKCHTVYTATKLTVCCPRCHAAVPAPPTQQWPLPGMRESNVRNWSRIFVRNRRIAVQQKEKTAPASPKKKQPTPQYEKTRKNVRSNARYAFKETFEIEFDEGKHTVCSVNISRGGMFIETNAPLRLGARIKLIAGFDDPSRKREILCVVRWIHSDNGVGLEFEQLKAMDAVWLNRIISDL